MEEDKLLIKIIGLIKVCWKLEYILKITIFEAKFDLNSLPN